MAPGPPPEAPLVRTASVADAHLAGQMLHAFNAEFATATPEPAVLAERLRSLLTQENVLLLLSGDPPHALAFLTFRPSVWDPGPTTLLEELYVHPDLRGQGIGGALLEHAIEAARARGSEQFEINVDEGDVDARRFYERHGFSNTEPGSQERFLFYERRIGEDPRA